MKIRRTAASSLISYLPVRKAVSLLWKATGAPQLSKLALTAANNIGSSLMVWSTAMLRSSGQFKMARIYNKTNSFATRKEIRRNQSHNTWICRKRGITVWTQNWNQKWTNSTNRSSIKLMSPAILGSIPEAESSLKLARLIQRRKVKFLDMEQNTEQKPISVVNSERTQEENCFSRSSWRRENGVNTKDQSRETGVIIMGAK